MLGSVTAMVRPAAAVVAVMWLTACASPGQAATSAPLLAALGAAPPVPRAKPSQTIPVPLPRAKPSLAVPPVAVIKPSRPLQCVAYARELSGIPIRGDAWTWWRAAEGRYARGSTPRLGAVLVFEKTKRLRRGHLAVVKRVLGPREILVDQANWLNGGRIHLNTPVKDVSPGNDWSVVRVWYSPGRRFGSHAYATYGFITQSRVAALP